MQTFMGAYVIDNKNQIFGELLLEKQILPSESGVWILPYGI
jgi:hypothetical protein